MIAVAFLFVVVPVALAALGLAAVRWGVDSRVDPPDRRRPESRIGIG
jgi:nitrogen fixation-related uncharacterized protein